jgi:hypothetical protein
MPPRYVYWTILIDNAPTAFRAAKREDLQPTFVQLQRTNPNIVMKWFARGRLWDSPEAEREAQRQPKVIEKRSLDWRPGGQHKDPRARFGKRKEKRVDRPRSSRPAPPARPDVAGHPAHPARPAPPARTARPDHPGRPDHARPARPTHSARPAHHPSRPSQRPVERRDRRK